MANFQLSSCRLSIDERYSHTSNLSKTDSKCPYEKVFQYYDRDKIIAEERLDDNGRYLMNLNLNINRQNTNICPDSSEASSFTTISKSLFSQINDPGLCASDPNSNTIRTELSSVESTIQEFNNVMLLESNDTQKISNSTISSSINIVEEVSEEVSTSHIIEITYFN